LSFPRYAKYKDSGVEWLGEVPEHWEVKPLKHLADFINGAAFKPSEWSESGMPIIRIQNLNGGEEFNYFDGEVEKRYLVHDGDLLFGWSGNRGTSFGPFLWRRNEVCALNQHIFRVVPYSADKGELYWILKAVTAQVEDQAHGIIGMVHVTKGDLGAINVPIPPPAEQTAIAAFLDRETGKIDALVAEQRRLMELLKEKRQAVISHAVTRGLNPAIPMKDSGIEWLGEVPEHWKVMPLKYAITLTSGGTPSKDNLAYWDGEVPWASSKDLKVDELFDTQDHISQFALDEGAAVLVPAGTILSVVRGMILLHTFPVVLTRVATAINQDLKAITPKTGMNVEYLAWLLRGSSSEVLSRTDEAAHGTKVLRIEAWLSMEIPIPPLAEQTAIVAHLEQELSKFDTLTAEAQRAIDLLQERRTALISAAVTGQIDVREVLAVA
jgi:type I restriction enzyme S subunit